MQITPERALQVVLSAVRPMRPRRLALGEATGCRLAEDVRNDRDQPPAHRSAMDGYAVIAADLRRAGARLRLIGEVAAGKPPGLTVRRGTCAAILTGGNVPRGADAVVPIEQTQRDGGEVVFRISPHVGENIRKRGEEARRGQVLLKKGAALGPAQIGVCALVGKARPSVHPRPGVAVLCTGDEILDASQRVTAHQLRDCNGPALLSALAEQGFCGVTRRLVSDELKAIVESLRRALRAADVVLVTGGVSVGQYDFVPQAVRRLGGRIRYHGVSMKPGKPQLYATLSGNRHVFGLPGNPVAVLTGFHAFVLPALRRLGGTPKDLCRPSARLSLAQAVRCKGDRTLFALARIVRRDDGLAALPVKSAGSADIIAACGADGVVLIPAGVPELPAGAMVEFQAWNTAAQT